MAQTGYGYRYLEGIVSGDAAFEVRAADLNSLFEMAAEAMFGIMVDIKAVVAEYETLIKLESSSLEELLFLYLSELIYLKDVERTIYCKFEAEISGKYLLKSTIAGQKVENLTEPPSIDIKAITYYKFKIEKVSDGYLSVVVVDL